MEGQASFIKFPRRPLPLPTAPSAPLPSLYCAEWKEGL
jgi:hypothetical protein